MIRIGIDVGGTNTDAVLLRGDTVLATAKQPTTEDVTAGVVHSLRLVLQQSGIAPAAVEAVMIGTTHFVNAVVQRRDLAPGGGASRGPAGGRADSAIHRLAGRPARHRAGRVFMVRGGHEYDGRPIMPMDTAAIRDAARQIRAAGINSVGVSAVFSPLTPRKRGDRRGDPARRNVPALAITCSHDLGRIGLLERENVTLAQRQPDPAGATRPSPHSNTPCAPWASMRRCIITQNDGTVVRAASAAAFPVHCFASGPTNSLRGAAFLSGLSEAVVIDIGGTTADFGALVRGFPRQANNVVQIGGVRTLFRMPDLLSIGLGGGTMRRSGDRTESVLAASASG